MFIVFTLPRSRSAWLSHFLAAPGTSVGHDITRHCSTVEDFLHAFNPTQARPGGLAGTVETAAMYGWKTIKSRLPQATLAVIRRPGNEVLESLAKLGVTDFQAELAARESMLDCISNLKGVLTLAYSDLALEERASELFTHCHGQAPADEWYEHWNRCNIQIDFPSRMAEIVANMPRLQRLREEITSENLRVSGMSRIGLQ